MAAGAVPIQESVGAALRFVRENLRFVLIAAGIGAAALSAVSAFTLVVPAAALLAMVASGVVQAFTYAAFVGCALAGAGAASTSWRKDGWRVWTSMVIIGFFLCIVMFVAFIPVSIVLAAGPLAPYVAELQQAGDNQEAVMSIMMRFLQENPGAVMGVSLFFGVIWFLLTSRLYLAAPASVDQSRTLTFETWKWTKGSVVRITLARLMLLAPAYILAGAVGHLLGRMIGINTLDPASVQAAVAANAPMLLVFDFVRSFIILALYAPLEAGLSTYLYRGLKPEGAAPAAA